MGQLSHQGRKCADRVSTRTRIRWRVGMFPIWRPDSKDCGFRDPIRWVRVDGRSDNISFWIQAIQVPCGRALHFMCGKCKLTSKLISSPGVPVVLCMSAYIYFLYLP